MWIGSNPNLNFIGATSFELKFIIKYLFKKIMKETNFIDNGTKVLDFMAMAETGEPEVAKKYLENNKWDVTSAANAFFGQINVNNNIDNNNVINISKNEININDNNKINNNLNNNNRLNNLPPNPPENQSFISGYIFGPIEGFFNSIIGTCKERREFDLEEEERIFLFYRIKFMIRTNSVN